MTGDGLFEGLDFLYMPSADVARDLGFYTQVLGGEAVFAGADGSPLIAFDALVPGEVGYPHSRVLFVLPLSLAGAAPVVGTTG